MPCDAHDAHDGFTSTHAEPTDGCWPTKTGAGEAGTSTGTSTGAWTGSGVGGTVAGAGADAGVDGFITERMGGAPDHPMTISFPEGEYLKGLVVMRKP